MDEVGGSVDSVISISENCLIDHVYKISDSDVDGEYKPMESSHRQCLYIISVLLHSKFSWFFSLLQLMDCTE